MFGDFNIIKYLVGRLGCKSFCPAMFKFSKFIKKHLSVNLPLVGGGGVIICGSRLEILLCLELIELWHRQIRRNIS